MNNDINVPPVDGLFLNGNAKGKICSFICLLFFFLTTTGSPLVSKRATFLLQKTIGSTYCILSIAH